MIKLRVGGVPEHFNYAWHLSVFRKTLAAAEVFAEWRDYPGGTGAMCRSLESDELDIALLLTEGAIAAISNGNPSQIVGTWVNSPLTWGIHASASRDAAQLPSLSEACYAISRYGSGSHLMAFINCQLRGLPLPDRFEVVGNLDGARAALAAGMADLFMWEKYTTKFLVDSGEFQRVDNCDTPWPCFVVAATHRALESKREAIWQVLAALRSTLARSPVNQSGDFIAEHYNLLPADVEAWSQRVSWSARPIVSAVAAQQAIDGLLAAGVIDHAPAEDKLFADFVELS